MSSIISIASLLKSAVGTHRGLSQTNEVIDLDGNVSTMPLTYLDSTASELANRRIDKEAKAFLENAYANTHTTGHHRGRDSTNAVEQSKESVGELVSYNKEKDMVIFNGTGATGPLNYLAQVLFPKHLRFINDPSLTDEKKKELFEKLNDDDKYVTEEIMEKPIVITTEMEHHANLLPWYETKNVRIVPVNKETGELDIEVLQKLLEENKGRVRLVTVSGASNVTGIINPIHDIAKMAHEAGAEICVDAAQLTPHRKIEKRRHNKNENLDYIVMSPHKFGVTGTPGVLVANKSLLDKNGRRHLVNVGGGMVNAVTAYPQRFIPTSDIAGNEQPGTNNIEGIVKVGLAAKYLARNMAKITEHEKELTIDLMKKLKPLERLGVKVVGDQDPEKRVGVISIDVSGVQNAVVASFLNDSFNISVRNGCFCAHPYMAKLAGLSQQEIDRISNSEDRSNLPGYTRVSFAEYSKKSDVDVVVDALNQLAQNKEKIVNLYEIDNHGEAHRKDRFMQAPTWSLDEADKRTALTEKMQSSGFDIKEAEKLLKIFKVSELEPIVQKHKNCKKVIEKVGEEILQSKTTNNECKVSVFKDILLNMYSSPEKGEHVARSQKNPLYVSENGNIHASKGWEKFIHDNIKASSEKTSSLGRRVQNRI